MKLGLKRGLKQLLLRTAIFLALSYLLIPIIIDKISSYTGLQLLGRFNYMPMVFFSFAFLFIFVLFNRASLKEIKEYKQDMLQSAVFVFLTASLLFVYFVIAYIPKSIGFPMNYDGIVLTNIVYFSAIITLGIAVFNISFIKKYFRSLAALFIIFSIFFASILLIRQSWMFFSSMITRITFFLISLTFPNSRMSVGNGDPTLAIGDFTVIIGSPCSGIDSLSMFSSLFLLICIYDWSMINKKKAAFLFLIGMAGSFIVSILRIYLLMVVGAYYPKFSMGLFHSNAGWILFVIYFLGFFYFTYPWMKKR